MIHIDLFSGIGGFALAVDTVWGKENVEHIFCDNEPFAQAVLKKHWPHSKIYGDIKTFTNAGHERQKEQKQQTVGGEKLCGSSRNGKSASYGGIAKTMQTYIITGGFPCQPFSQAGRRKGTEDDRHLWPYMLECISLFRPRWVIAENVAGLLTIGGGVVFETVCSDLEKEGYEVQAFVIPAVAVGAPHRRDRIWIVARSNVDDSKSRGRNIRIGKHKRTATGEVNTSGDTDKDVANSRQQHGSKGNEQGMETNQEIRSTRPTDTERQGEDGEYAPDTESEGGKFGRQTGRDSSRIEEGIFGRESWNQNWLEVATRLCRVDDGLPRRLDRNSRLKALGNAIVPQVAEEIMRVIKSSE